MADLVVTGGDLVWSGDSWRGGHIVFILHWLHGLRRLGHRVLYCDLIDSDDVRAAALFRDVVERWWEPSLAAAVDPKSGSATVGKSAGEVATFARAADALVTLGCRSTREPEPWLAEAPLHILIDQDPGYTHVWAIDHGEPLDIFGQHDRYFTVGANVGTPRSDLPSFEIEWLHTRNPVILDWWGRHSGPTRGFTTVAGGWEKGYQEFGGRLWGPKVEQFAEMIDLPARIPETLEVVLDVDDDDPMKVRMLKHGWSIQRPKTVAKPDAYRRYISASTGEFSCANGIYIGTRSGWFSDRSACYLAAGRPVVMQDTGFADDLPTGEGLFAFIEANDAIEAIGAIRGDYERHSRAASEIAREYFDSDVILRRLLDDAGL
jgi:hypothetical protein